MSFQTSENNKRIAKNTLLLYFRMLLTIVVGLYTSRVVLNTLGVSDYGVYNVVGGIVAMLSFLNSALSAASQRFLAFELGRGDLSRLRKIFCTSVTIHVALAVIIFIIAETIGLWFVNAYLNIDADRMVAANWVYQFSIFTFMLTVVSVPYNACIIAHEHMNAFAYVSILEVTLKLLIVYLLLVINCDKLITYGILVFGVALIVRLTYGIYCKHHFRECSYRFAFERHLAKEMFAFAGWSVIGNIGFTFKDQWANIILNLFFGTTVNAARGIAMQVNGILLNFSNNFMIALAPQITKQYASGNKTQCIQLVYAGSRYSFYLLTLVAIPVIINTDYILNLWLGIVPEFTAEFMQLSLIASLINSMAIPLVIAIQATGQIKVFQIIICMIMLCELPLAYLILYFGGSPYMAMCPTVFVTFVGLFARFLILKRLVPRYDLKYFTFAIVVKNLSLGFLCFCFSSFIHRMLGGGLFAFVSSSAISCFIVLIVFYSLGLTVSERMVVRKKMKSKLLHMLKRY